MNIFRLLSVLLRSGLSRHKNKSLILEGPNYCGKSTFALAMAHEHHGVTDEDEGEFTKKLIYTDFYNKATRMPNSVIERYYDLMLEHITSNKRNVRIWDRCWISEYVYAEAEGRYTPISRTHALALTTVALLNGTNILYFRRSDESFEANKEALLTRLQQHQFPEMPYHNNEAYLEQFYKKVVSLYEGFFEELTRIWPMLDKRIIRLIADNPET